MSRKMLAVFAVVTMLVALFALTGAANAARTSSSVRASSPTLNFPAMQQHCAVLNVYLNGTTHPGVACLHRQLLTKQAGVKHYTTTGPCDGTQTMVIVYNNNNNEICFHGTGYFAGFGVLSNVTLVQVALSAGWFLWYDTSGSHYCTLDNAGISPLVGQSVSITQVNPGNTKLGLCG